ncbi:hypothetical protein HBI56_101120 [Parastagonospora nodorum]|nr:hypothetical protein HBH53_178740 [Parastagonospora nodorum]KAH3959317.1 hypothetical protein HBH51_201090 [Parastagonospora nodorum]KAH3984803.1 hypothetical protein HBH52_050790 [Parastagonospora nodorum]KAH4006308.1 hypothetical protein HBI10_022950 [Parastagonospora nodorum]KAH4011974.1 hypothetical protein HBI13_193310 [Parastagonospora nodorum]
MFAAALIEAGSIEYYEPMLNRPVLNRGLLISAIHKTQQNIDFMVPFGALLGYSRHQEFTNVKDRVYGLLGLQTVESIHTGGATFVVPDYSLSDKACFQQVAEKILIEGQDLSFLSRVRHVPDMHTDWPSWVPQWNKWRFTGQIRTSIPSFESPKEPCIRKETAGIYTYLCIDRFIIDSVHQILWQNVDSDDGRSSVPFQDYQDIISALSTIYGLHCLLETFGESDTFRNTAFGEWEEHYHTFMEEHADELIYDFDSPLLYWGARAFCGAMHKNTSNQVVFRLKENYLGIGPEILEEGDIIVYFYGAEVPFALRPQDGHWRFVGECYMHEFVQCHDIKSWSKNGGQSEAFRIV